MKRGGTARRFDEEMISDLEKQQTVIIILLLNYLIICCSCMVVVLLRFKYFNCSSIALFLFFNLPRLLILLEMTAHGLK